MSWWPSAPKASRAEAIRPERHARTTPAKLRDTPGQPLALRVGACIDDPAAAISNQTGRLSAIAWYARGRRALLDAV
jgi:hypothetical protein